MPSPETQLPAAPTYTFSRIVFYTCAVYFLAMGLGLVLFPRFLVSGVAGTEVHPTLIGMLRGSGGAVIPYALLYLLTARNPASSLWVLSVIAVANTVAIMLDISSVLLDEYTLAYAMIDLPVEVVSLAAVMMVWIKMRRLPQT
jgi:hypothetical protein